jgi:hypothetical protein
MTQTLYANMNKIKILKKGEKKKRKTDCPLLEM